MFASKPNYLKLRTNLRLCINRLKLLEKKKTELALKARREIADYITAGKDDRARIRVEHIIREDYLVEAMEIVEMLCDLLLARFGLIERMSELDPGIEEAVATLIWVAPRLSGDIQELREVAHQLTIKYGKEFGEMCRRNGFESVNEKVVHKMSLAAPPKILVEHYMIEIARTYKVPFEPDPLVMMGQPPETNSLIDLGVDALSPKSGMGTSAGSNPAQQKAMEAGQVAGGGGGPGGQLLLPPIPGSIGASGMGFGYGSGGGSSSGYTIAGANNGFPGIGGAGGGGGVGGYGYCQPGNGNTSGAGFGYGSSGGTSVGSGGVFGTVGGVSSDNAGCANSGQNVAGSTAYGATGGASSSGGGGNPMYTSVGGGGAAAGGIDGFQGGMAFGGGNTKMAGGNTKMAGSNTNMAGGNTSMAGGNTNVAGGDTNMAGGSSNIAGGNTNLAGGINSVAGRNTNMAGGNTYMAGGNTYVAGRNDADYSAALIGGVPVLPSEGQFPPPVPEGYLPPSGILPSPSQPSHPGDARAVDIPRAGPGTAGRAPMNPQMSWINDDYLPSLPPYDQVVSSPDQYPTAQPGQRQPSFGTDATASNHLPDFPTLPDVPGLPSIPTNSIGGASVGGDDVDFDDLTRRFEELKKRK